jgi:hypothetical protein
LPEKRRSDRSHGWPRTTMCEPQGVMEGSVTRSGFRARP